MLRESKQKVVEGTTYTVTQLGAVTGRKVLLRLMKVYGVAVSSPDPIPALLSALTDEDLTFVCDEFAKYSTYCTSADPSKSPELAQMFDFHFAGNYSNMLTWLAFCVEVNYGSFLAKIRSQLEGAVTAVGKTASNSPNT